MLNLTSDQLFVFVRLLDITDVLYVRKSCKLIEHVCSKGTAQLEIAGFVVILLFFKIIVGCRLHV